MGGKEKVIVLVEQGTVQGDEGLPLVVVEGVAWARLSILGAVDLDAFLLYHNEPGVDNFNPGY